MTNPENLVTWFKRHFKELRKLCKQYAEHQKQKKAQKRAEKRKQAKLEAARERKRKNLEEKALDTQSVGKIIISNLRLSGLDDPENYLREVITNIIAERDIGAHVTSVYIPSNDQDDYQQSQPKLTQAKVTSKCNGFLLVCVFCAVVILLSKGLRHAYIRCVIHTYAGGN